MNKKSGPEDAQAVVIGAVRRDGCRSRGVLLMVLAAAVIGGPVGHAQPDVQRVERAEPPALYRSDGDQFQVAVNKSGVIHVDEAVKRVSVGNPGVADVLVLRANEVYVVGKAIGSTNLTLWGQDDRVFATLNLNVTQDLESLKRKLHDLFPDDRVGVRSAQERIILDGRVSSLSKMAAAKELAVGFLSDCVVPSSDVQLRDHTGEAPVLFRQGGNVGTGDQSCKKGKVINLMEVGGAQQIMLEVKVAEVARTLLDRLDGSINLLKFGSDGNAGLTSNGAVLPPGGFSGSGGPPGSPGNVITSPGQIDMTGLFGNLLTDNNYFLQAILEISRRNDLAKILAEPTLTTQSGQEAEFLSGGEFPIPVPQGGGSDTVTIEFKDFGVGVKFVPVVLDSGHINLKLSVSVSDITQANSVFIQSRGTDNTFVVPSLTKRSANSTVELANGQTIGIAGLISDNVREFVDKFPLLGDIPVLGAFFRSQEFRHDESELVIFVTPHLARPIAPDQVRLPTDQFVPPNAYEFYLLGRMESGREPSRGAKSAVFDGGATGSRFGHAQ